MLADYQYILNVPDPIDEDDEYTLMGIVQKLLTPSLKTNTEGVETFALTSLKNIPKNREGESISVYGIQKDSKYVSAELFEDGVTISDGYAEKYGMKVGDTLELKEYLCLPGSPCGISADGCLLRGIRSSRGLL